MSIRTELRYYVRCDDCGAEHHDRSTGSALEGRVAAGLVGWQFEVAKDRGGPGAGPGAARGRRVHFDRCPKCRATAEETGRG